ncbi:MAG: YqgE/AlgH family protein [Bacteroidales bacterium]|nr:YqgE/AlgH family protein [Bacteroidales bacterium]
MQSDLDLFAILPEDKIPEKGKILISEPFMPDVFFNRSIVYLTEHTPEGSTGFILNKKLDITVCEVINGFGKWDAVIGIGGPVALGTLHYLHSLGKIIPDSVEVGNSIFWGGDIDALKHAIKTGKAATGQIRFFMGYSVWSAGQLDRELDENSWVTASAEYDMVMNGYGSDLWKHTLKSLNAKYHVWAGFPKIPNMN